MGTSELHRTSIMLATKALITNRAEFEGYEFGKEDLQKLKVACELVNTALKKCS